MHLGLDMSVATSHFKLQPKVMGDKVFPVFQCMSNVHDFEGEQQMSVIEIDYRRYQTIIIRPTTTYSS